MFFLRRFLFSPRRCHFRKWSSDLFFSQLNKCTNEDQVFDLVGKNKTKLSEKHVETTFDILWQFQKKKPEILRNTNYLRDHPHFLILRILAENKIEYMNNEALVNTLYNLLRFGVDAHDSVVEEMVMEGWRRLDNLNMPELSKFALCLYEQQMYHSPLMGQIAEIVNKNLATMQDMRGFSVLTVSISGVISQSFRDRLVERAEFLLDTVDPIPVNHARRFIQFLRNVKLSHRPLLHKCNKIFLQNVSQLDLDNTAIILGFYQVLQFNNREFRLAAKQKLTEMMDDCTSPSRFTRLFAALAPMAGPDVREQLIEAAVLMADEFDHHQVLAVIETMSEMECRSSQLIQKISFLLHKYLDLYKPTELARLTQSLVFLRCPHPDLYSKLQRLLIDCLKVNVIPADISMLIRTLSMLPSSYMDEVIVSRIDAIAHQCSLSDLSSFATAIIKWVRRDQSSRQSPSGLYGTLLQKVNNCAYQRLQKANDLDLLLEEMRYVSGEWLEEMLLEDAIAVFQRLMDQITWTNVLEFSYFLTKTSYLCTPLLDRIAAVTLQHSDKIYNSGTYSLILPFTILNYDPPQSEEFFKTCIGHFSTHLGSFEPHVLVLLGFALAVAQYFPENLAAAIFNVDFLAKLDAQLEALPATFNRRVRLRLMELNRAVCLECPEFQVPWFHERYCQQLQQRSGSGLSALQRQIHRLLGEILGGSHFAKASVLTPYYYKIDFECILDRNKKPLPYVEQNVVVAELERVRWGHDGQFVGKKGLPPGAQRIAVEFLESKAFCKNSPHLRGETAMKKRHLEILGYQVVQIPHFEWNSMELSSKNAWMDYLKKKIFEEV
ncbi:FAST kinase domain-containing protein 1, mitochondrial [Eublepharis macularius]|uniref:FAST kinase domain-containing protein 1, mitochondrial n=1 Tax=Eublepharis macularius TaxID=481883 RepID=A0AA97IWA8_EUBMA|nr:FAST kinase domain-containing protein 1, mitochondrial [Eublepharis macularius]